MARETEAWLTKSMIQRDHPTSAKGGQDRPILTNYAEECIYQLKNFLSVAKVMTV